MRALMLLLTLAPLTLEAVACSTSEPRDRAVDGGSEDADANQVDAAPGPRCGDGVKNGGETCDGNDLGDTTCAGLGFAGGTVTCAATCDGFDVAACAAPQCLPNPCVQPNQSRCEPFGNGFRCLCDEGFVEVGGECVDARAALCDEAHTEGDAFEPDECFEAATELQVGVPQAHTMSPANDVDWLWFAARGRTAHRLQLVWSTPPPSEATVEVLDEALHPAAMGSFDRAPGPSELVLEPLRDERFFVRVTGARDYTIELSLIDDDHGDDASSATPLQSGVPTPGEIEYARDADWFGIDCAIDDILLVDVAPARATTVAILAPDGLTTLAAGMTPLVARCSEAGRHHIRVAADEASGYVLTVERTRDAWPDGCPEDAPAFAGDGSFTGLVELPEDRDCARFTTRDEEIFRFDLASSAPLPWVVFRTDGPLTVPAVAGVTSNAVRLPAGSTCVCVGPGGRPRTTFAFSTTSLGRDDHGDTGADATALTLGAPPTPFALQFTDDVDVFLAQVPVGHHARVVLDPAGTLPQVSRDEALTMRIVTNLLRSYDNAPIYVVLSQDLNRSGTVALIDLGSDDHGDDEDHATALAINDVATAGTLPSHDKDWFSVQTVQGGAHRLVIETSGTLRLTRYRLSGRSVIADGPPQLVQATGQLVEIALSLSPMMTTWFELTPVAGSAPQYSLRVQAP
jgi:hypothetical protein